MSSSPSALATLIVLDLDHEVFEEILEEEKARLGYELDTGLSAIQWQGVIAHYKAISI